MDKPQQEPSKPETTVGDKSHEAQNYDNRTASGSMHNYQAVNATDPAQLADERRKAAEQAESNPGDDDFRQHDAGG